MLPDFIDPYIDQSTGILANIPGARTWDELKQAEGELVGARLLQLFADPPTICDGSLDELKIIHHLLFQDVYTWAGQIRTVEIRKNIEGSEFFLPSTNIGIGIAWSQSELKSDHMLKGLNRSNFAERLAYHYDNYNFVHPFREGNGRTQRVLWTMLCHSAGYDLDWRRVSGDENDNASRMAAEDRDYSALISIFTRIAHPCDPQRPFNINLIQTGHLDER